MLISVIVVVGLASGGYLTHRSLSHTNGHDAIVDTGSGPSGTSVLLAAQPAVSGPVIPAPVGSPSPSRSPSAHGTPKPTSTPKPTHTTAKPPPVTVPPATSAIVGQLLAQINQFRTRHGLAPYTLLGGLNASAHKHNLKMMGSCGMSHQCPGEPGLGERVSAQGVSWSYCGENIGYSRPHPDTAAGRVAAAEGITTAMYNEKPPNDGHRQNLLSTRFHHIGIDVVRTSSGTVWLTQDFSD